jgi:hypothetical protein
MRNVSATASVVFERRLIPLSVLNEKESTGYTYSRVFLTHEVLEVQDGNGQA